MKESVNVESVLRHLPPEVSLLDDIVPKSTWCSGPWHTAGHADDDRRVIHSGSDIKPSTIGFRVIL